MSDRLRSALIAAGAAFIVAMIAFCFIAAGVSWIVEPGAYENEGMPVVGRFLVVVISGAAFVWQWGRGK